MPVETADDRLLMLADFGVTVSYTYADATVTSFTGIFDSDYQAVDAGGGVAFAMQQPRVTCRTADVSGALEGDTAVIEGVTYTVRVVMDDGTGITELTLEKA
jgi:hypothetical protein